MSLIVGRKKNRLLDRLRAMYPQEKFELDFVFTKSRFRFRVTEKGTGKVLASEEARSYLMVQRMWVMFLLPPCALIGAVGAEAVGRRLGAPPLSVFFGTVAALALHGWGLLHWLAAFGKYQEEDGLAGAGAPEEYMAAHFRRAKSSTKKADMVARALLGYWGAAKQSPIFGRCTAWPWQFWRMTANAFPIERIREAVLDGLSDLEKVPDENARTINPQQNWDDAMVTCVSYSKVLKKLWGRPLTPYAYAYFVLSIAATIFSALAVIEKIR